MIIPELYDYKHIYRFCSCIRKEEKRRSKAELAGIRKLKYDLGENNRRVKRHTMHSD